MGKLLIASLHLEEFIKGILSPHISLFSVWSISPIHLISFAVNNGASKPITLGRWVPFVLHLFFYDDLVLFSEALKGQMDMIQCCLDIFCDISSEKVSKEKTRFFFALEMLTTIFPPP